MNILIRTDASGPYGMGHAVRCKALAKALHDKGNRVEFVTRTPLLSTFVAPFRCEETIAYDDCPTNKHDMLIVDTKMMPWDGEDDWAYDPGYLWALRDEGVKVALIDYPDAEEDSCDLLVAPGNHWEETTVNRCRNEWGNHFLYGWDYVLLAPEVTAQQPIPYEERRNGPVVFCAGGSDPGDALVSMWGWMNGKDDFPMRWFLLPTQAAYTLPRGYVVDVIDIRDCWRKRQTGQMALSFDRKYLREAALVVGMMGIIPYECLWYHTPMLIYAHTDENALGAHLLQKASQDHVCYGGMIQECTQSVFCNTVGLVYEATIRKVAQPPTLIDGQGLQRVADAILALGQETR